MKVLVDTSVWSLALRRNLPSPHPKVEKLRSWIESGEEVFLLGVIFTELLQGFREKKDFDRVHKALEPFPLLDLTRHDYRFAAEIRNLCLTKGIQTSTIDVLIAAAAIEHEIPLLTTDNDFDRIASVVPLELI